MGIGATTAWNTYIQQLLDVESSSAVTTYREGIAKTLASEEPVFAFLNKRPHKTHNGGGNITFNFRTGYPEAQAIQNNQTITPIKDNYIKHGVLPMAMYNITIDYNLTDIMINSGDRLYDYVTQKIDEAKIGMGRTLGKEFFGTGTTDAEGNALTNASAVHIIGTGIASTGGFCPTTTTSGTYAGYTRTSSTLHFNNQAATTGGSGVASIQLTMINELISKVSLPGLTTGLITCSKAAFRELQKKAAAAGYDTAPSGEVADLGFGENIKFGSAVVIPSLALTSAAEGGFASADVKRMYGFCLESIDIYDDPGINMAMGGLIELDNANVYRRKLNHAICVVCNNPARNWVLSWS